MLKNKKKLNKKICSANTIYKTIETNLYFPRKEKYYENKT